MTLIEIQKKEKCLQILWRHAAQQDPQQDPHQMSPGSWFSTWITDDFYIPPDLGTFICMPTCFNHHLDFFAKSIYSRLLFISPRLLGHPSFVVFTTWTLVKRRQTKNLTSRSRWRERLKHKAEAAWTVSGLAYLTSADIFIALCEFFSISHFQTQFTSVSPPTTNIYPQTQQFKPDSDDCNIIMENKNTFLFPSVCSNTKWTHTNKMLHSSACLTFN